MPSSIMTMTPNTTAASRSASGVDHSSQPAPAASVASTPIRAHQKR